MEAKPTPQPAQTDSSVDLLIWLDQNKTKLIAVVGLAVVAVAGYNFVSWKARAKETGANEALFALPMASIKGSPLPQGEAFLKVADEHPGTAAAERAALLGAGYLFSNGKFDAAKTQFEKFLNDYPATTLQSQANFGIAASLEGAGKTDEALKKYQEISGRFPQETVAALAKLSSARILEAQGKDEEAVKIYTAFSKQDLWKSEADVRLEKIVTRRPELAPAESMEAQPGDQIISVTTPPEGSTNAPVVEVITNVPPK